MNERGQTPIPTFLTGEEDESQRDFVAIVAKKKEKVE